MSNRFRNLKLGRTFNLASNRLAPMDLHGVGSDPNATIRSNSNSIKVIVARQTYLKMYSNTSVLC